VARYASLILAVGIMLIAGYAVFAAKGWQWKAALFPLAIGIPLFCLAAVETVWSLARKETSEEPPQRGAALSWAWMAGFVALILLLGFPIAVAVFVFAYLKVQAKEGWLLSIVYTAILWAAFHGLFDQLLHLPFPAGWLIEWLGFA
jgi:hypothetical protein